MTDRAPLPPPPPGDRGHGPHSVPPRAPAPHPAGPVPYSAGPVPHSAGPAQAPRRRPFIGLGVTLLVLGVLGIGAAVLIFILPFGLFLLGGGGNTEAFDGFAAGFQITALVVAALSVCAIGGGITLLIIGSRRR